jgi:hypothetical protein
LNYLVSVFVFTTFLCTLVPSLFSLSLVVVVVVVVDASPAFVVAGVVDVVVVLLVAAAVESAAACIAAFAAAVSVAAGATVVVVVVLVAAESVLEASPLPLPHEAKQSPIQSVNTLNFNNFIKFDLDCS